MNLPNSKEIRKMTWPKFVPLIEEACKNDKIIELSMYKNYWLRFPMIVKNEVVIEQQHVIVRKDIKRLMREIQNVDLSIWWKSIRGDIFRVRLKGE